MPISVRNCRSAWPELVTNSRPSKRMVPSSGCSSLLMHRMSVDLPDPDGPHTTTRSPTATDSDTLSSAVKFPKRLTTDSSLTSGSPAAMSAGAAAGSGNIQVWGNVGAVYFSYRNIDEVRHTMKIKALSTRRQALIGGAALLVASLPFSAAHAADSVLDDILADGKLLVGTTGDWDPMSMKDPATNTYKGYDIDVVTELAKDLEVEVEFVATDWKTLVNGIAAGKYHMTGSASISPARAKAAGYTDSYFSLATVPLTLKKNEGVFNDWADLDNAEVTVAATLGTTQEQQVKDFFPSAEHKIIEAPARDFQEVLAGRADAHITSNVEAYKLVAKYEELMVVPVAEPKARTPIAMLVPQGDQVWINYLNTWIKLKTERGFFDELGTKWQLSN